MDTLYASDVVSVEAAQMPGMERIAKGVDAVSRKNQWWGDNHEVLAGEISDPYPHGEERFAVRFTYDVTNKPNARSMKMGEIAVFTVANGKVVREEFFYPTSG